MKLTDQSVVPGERGGIVTLAAERIKLSTTRAPLWMAVVAGALSLALAALQGSPRQRLRRCRRSVPQSVSQPLGCR